MSNLRKQYRGREKLKYTRDYPPYYVVANLKFFIFTCLSTSLARLRLTFEAFQDPAEEDRREQSNHYQWMGWQYHFVMPYLYPATVMHKFGLQVPDVVRYVHLMFI